MKNYLFLILLLAWSANGLASVTQTKIEGTKVKSTGQLNGKVLTSDGAGGAGWQSGGGGGGAGITSINSSNTAAQTIVGSNNISVSSAGGTTTVNGSLLAPQASPTFTGTITAPLTASRAVVTGASSELASSAVTATELGYVSGVTSAVQTQMNLKAPLASPTFTGTVTLPLGAGIVHSSAGGVTSSSPVALATEVSGNLPVTNLNGGTSASGTTFWRGDGVWAAPAGGGGTTVGGAVTSGTANRVLYEGAGNVLAESANLQFDGTTLTHKEFVLRTGTGDESVGDYSHLMGAKTVTRIGTNSVDIIRIMSNGSLGTGSAGYTQFRSDMIFANQSNNSNTTLFGALQVGGTTVQLPPLAGFIGTDGLMVGATAGGSGKPNYALDVRSSGTASMQLTTDSTGHASTDGALFQHDGTNVIIKNQEAGGNIILDAVSVIEKNTATPASASATCVTGQHAWDSSFEYRCVATNTWKRAALSTW